MAISAGREEGEPMMDMNTTPLIDVMLVLLVMFIITIPIQTHAVKIDLPPKSDKPPPLVKPLKNDLILTYDNLILWNGAPVSLSTLKTLLLQSLDKSRFPTEPELHFAPAPDARFELVDTVLATIKYTKVNRMGFVGNEGFSNF